MLDSKYKEWLVKGKDMNKEHKENNDSLVNQELLSGLGKSSGNLAKQSFSESNLGTVSLIKLVSAIVQVTLGSAVIVISVMELINPSWLATVMSIFGSISVFTGLFASYTLISRRENFNFLINKAIKRVITFQN